MKASTCSGSRFFFSLASVAQWLVPKSFLLASNSTIDGVMLNQKMLSGPRLIADPA
uniref:Uncharacterized protein n=1 Tax=Arundo donax TaxID=35708 RepID=A0A0A9H2P6_ARUDO